LNSNSVTGEFFLNQTLYSGGAISANISAGAAKWMVAVQALRQAEENVILQAIQAYYDYLRDQAIVDINTKYLKQLQKQLDETTARMKGGDQTKTDVVQAAAQVSAEAAALSAAQGQLRTSRNEFVAVVGQEPVDLHIPLPLPGEPSSVREAVDIAEHENPGVLSARFTESMSRALVVEAKASRMPTVGLSASYGVSAPFIPFSARNLTRSWAVGIETTLPIFTSGLIPSQIRQAAAQNVSDVNSIEVARRNMVQNVTDAWDAKTALDAELLQLLKQVDLAQQTADDMLIEYHAGQRTSYDVLVADSTLANAKLTAAVAIHDSYVASADILYSIGTLEAPSLVSGLSRYDASMHLRQIEWPYVSLLRKVFDSLDHVGAPNDHTEAIVAPSALALWRASGSASTIAPSTRPDVDAKGGDLSARRFTCDS
jgi:outer membrane protein